MVQEFEIPPPPEQIARPAVPVLSTNVNISEDITIGEVTFDENPVSDLPPPPTGQGVDVADAADLHPVRGEAGAVATARSSDACWSGKYPPMLSDAGIGGTVVLWVFIDENGVREEHPRHPELGLRPAGPGGAGRHGARRKFTPALNRDQKVPVWIQLPVTFQTR